MIIEKKKSLKEYTTFKIGGPARFFCIVTNKDELIEAINFSKKSKLPFFILGKGSNILVSDDGFPGIAIKMEMKGITYMEDGNTVKVTVASGEDWDTLVKETVEKGFYGLENISYIPGTVVDSPVQNIGAYVIELKYMI